MRSLRNEELFKKGSFSVGFLWSSFGKQRDRLAASPWSKLFWVVLLAGLLVSFSPLPKISFVFDGDTVLLESGEKVRYLGIDAPEMDHKGGRSDFMAREAMNFNQELTFEKHIRLEYDVQKTDRHGRLLAYVYLPDGTMVNEALLVKGMAHVLSTPPNLKYRNRLIEVQRKAMEEGLGIWSQAGIKKKGVYPGNRQSYRFHQINCSFGMKIHPRNRIVFESPYQAFWEGYSPCSKCFPKAGGR